MRKEEEITALDLVAMPMLENKEVPPQLKLRIKVNIKVWSAYIVML